MSRAIVVLRPEPGNTATAARIAALGLTPLALPLFGISPVAWIAPDPGDHDALLLTSANAVRMGGAGLTALRSLPVLAVGEATAAVARAAGFDVIAVGRAGVTALAALASDRDIRRALHLAGRDRQPPETTVSRTITVYASDAYSYDHARLAVLERAVALLHSSRAATRLRALVDQEALDPALIRVAALSPAIADAAEGPAWQALATAAAPSDTALLDIAARLAD